MKTSFHFGNLNKQKYKSYYYHGLKLICKEPFHPPPYIIFPLHTPINPPNYFYECDGLPDTATPPLTKMDLVNFNLSSSNSLLHLVGTRIRPGVSPLAIYFWQFGYKDYVDPTKGVLFGGSSYTTGDNLQRVNAEPTPSHGSYASQVRTTSTGNMLIGFSGKLTAAGSSLKIGRASCRERV